MTDVRVSLNTRTLKRLLNSGQLCVADMKCLDCTSKECIWKMLLENSLHGTEKETDKVADKENSRPLQKLIKCEEW